MHVRLSGALHRAFPHERVWYLKPVSTGPEEDADDGHLARFSPIFIPGGQVTMVALPVIHRVVGSLVLAGALVLALRAVTARPAVVTARGVVIPFTAARAVRRESTAAGGAR